MPYVRLCRRRDVTTDQIFAEIMPLPFHLPPTRTTIVCPLNFQLSALRSRSGEGERLHWKLLSQRSIFNVLFIRVIFHFDVLNIALNSVFKENLIRVSISYSGRGQGDI